MQYIFHERFTEFQEAFNLFDNRGDGKIQLNQVRAHIFQDIYFFVSNHIGFLWIN